MNLGPVLVSVRYLGQLQRFGWLCFCLCLPSAYADIYQDRLLSADEAFGLAKLLSNAVVPGGNREMVINDNKMHVTRHVLPGRSKGASVLDEVQRGYETGTQDNDFDARDYDVLDAMIVAEEPEANLTAEAQSMMADERARIVQKLEMPFRYRAGIWDIYARIPIAAVNPENPLRALPAEAGFIYMAELNPERSQGYWEIRFGEGFVLGNISANHAGDAPGFDPPVDRYPSSKRTLTYQETANNWESVSWSFQGRGQVKAQLEHYVAQFEALGFERKAIGKHAGDEALTQMARGSDQVVIYVVDTGASPQPIQVTIQSSSYH